MLSIEVLKDTVLLKSTYTFYFYFRILYKHYCNILLQNEPFLVCLHSCLVSGRSSAYGDATAEGHPAGPGSVSSSTGAISTTTAQQEGEGSEGEAETEGDVHTSNRSDSEGRWIILSTNEQLVFYF